MIKFLVVTLILLVNSNKLVSSYDCRLLSDIDIRLNASDFKPFDSIYSKCGLIPGQFLSNQKKHGVFYINWRFNTKHSFKLDFSLENIEDISILNYFYSYRKFSSSNEIATNVTKFESQKINKSFKSNENANHSENSLIFEYESMHHGSTSASDLLKSMYVICVMIINLKEGTVFTMPFMCIDVFVDQSYYKALKDTLETNHYGIVITLAPLAIFFLILISVFYFKFYSKKPSTETLARLIEMTRNNLLAVDLIKKIEENVNTNRRYSRYEDSKNFNQLSDDLLLTELKTCIANNPTDSIKNRANKKPEFEEIYV